MMKRIIFLSALIIFFSAGLKLTFSAQNYSQREAAAGDCSEGLSRMEAKIEGLNSDLRGANREILKKLDQVLSNQERIFQELAIIKVRASKR